MTKAAIFFASMLLSFQLLAQGGGWGRNGQYGRLFNAATVETIIGDVERVEIVKPMRGMSHGVHLTLKTDKETLSAHLGPQWYLDKQTMKFTAGERVEIRGSRITFESKPALVAVEVKKGGEILTLRDSTGVPTWAGGGRRR